MLLFFLTSVVAFGSSGHETVAAIADNLLSPAAHNKLEEILPKGMTLVDGSTWPDRIKSDKRFGWSEPHHYVNAENDFPPYSCQSVFPSGKNDVISAIVKYAEELAKNDESKGYVYSKRAEALFFLTHYIGDIHQPLHGKLV